MKIESYGISDIGLVRLNNEDVFAIMEKEQFFILADGMGGHNAGEVAAQETVLYLCNFIKHLTKHPSTLSTQEWMEKIKEGVQDANALIFRLACEDKEKEGMGTTLCLMLIVKHTLIFAHVGDSRIYRIRKGRITQLTHDHSLKEQLIAQGKLDEKKGPSFPYRNVITRAIGTQRVVAPEINFCSVESEDMYFMCSDGLTDRMSDAKILSTICSSFSLQRATENLILQAKKEGGEDNITILMIKAK